MIDLGIVRKDPEKARQGLKNRGGRSLAAFEELIRLDAEHREALKKVEELRAERNAASQAIGKAKASKQEEEAQRLMAAVAEGKARMAELERALTPLAEKTRLAQLSIQICPMNQFPWARGRRTIPSCAPAPSRGISILSRWTTRRWEKN